MNEVIESAEAATEAEGADFEVVAMDEDLNTAEAQAADEAAAEDNAAPHNVQSMAERMAVIEALVFVADEPLSTKTIAEVLKEDRQLIEDSVAELEKDFNGRNSGLQLREVGGGWQFATRAEYHEHVRAFLKSRPSAKLSLASLETLAVIAYKQPVTVPEILEIRGVQSPSSIKTLLDKKLIVAKGRKDTVGRPMMYGTSKEFLIQFGLKDLSELPSIEDFEDLAGGA